MSDQVSTFRYNRRLGWGGAFLSGALLLLALLAVLTAPGFGASALDPLWGALCLLFLGVLFAVFLRVALRPPVVLIVGPDGVMLPVGFASPLPWRDIHRIREDAPQRHLAGRRHWLVIDPLPGVLPNYRLAGPRQAEMWLMRRNGLRIPLHALAASGEDVIAAIERFRPVARAR